MTINLTIPGMNALFRAIAGKQLVFTKVVIGNGAEQELATVSAIANPLLTLTLDEITVADTNAKLTVRFRNSTISSGFRCTEVGIFCKDPADATTEVLYAYGTEDDATAEYIAPAAGEVQETQIDFFVFISNAENVSAVINQSLVYATQAELSEHTGAKNNPHSVTAQQVGLGNVPNVSTNDQTPTYSDANTLTTLSSGEKLGIAFGKIKGAITRLINHLNNKSNPHGVTTSQIGASPNTHKHTASDLTSGVLGVSRGGTGRGSWSRNSMIFVNDSMGLAQLTMPTMNNSVLRQNTSGAPFWGSALSCEERGYIGTGEYGDMVQDRSAITFAGVAPSIIFISALDDVGFAVMFVSSGRFYSFANNAWSVGTLLYDQATKTLSWWSNTSEAAQMNTLNKSYRCYALS